jgi:hypothetical protein
MLAGFAVLLSSVCAWAGDSRAPEASAVANSDAESEFVRRRNEQVKLLPAVKSPPQVTAPVFNPIDQFIVAVWPNGASGSNGHTPEVCDDATFARRVYLDLTGVVPTVIELNQFLVDSSEGKRRKLVDHLLSRRADYAAHWTPFWEDALASQTVLAQGGIPTRGNYRDWILQSFERNRPFDVMVAELLDPAMPGRKTAVRQDIFGVEYTIEYVRNEDHTQTLQTAANVGQVFLGTAMKCASCHDSFDRPQWTQDRFLGFAGLFAPQDLERIRCDAHSGQYVPARFPFLLSGSDQRMPEDANVRLHHVARWITDPQNPRFARSIVNRLWKRYLGCGLVEPADDFRDDVPASHPELLDWLADDFARHGYDLQHTIRLILTSRTYQLRYDPQLEDRLVAEQPGAPRYFRSPALRRLTAEQVLDSIRVASSGVTIKPSERSYLDMTSTALARALGRPATRNEISTARPEDFAILQALELLNGHALEEMIAPDVRLTRSPREAELRKAVDRLYRATLSRPATLEEKKLGQTMIMSAGSPQEGLVDLAWALFVSPEFQYIK